MRSFESAVAYAPNQVFIGNLTPDELAGIERPWYCRPLPTASAGGPFGRIYDQSAFYQLLSDADDFGLMHAEGEGGLPLSSGGQAAGWIETQLPLDPEIVRCSIATWLAATLTLRTATASPR